MTTPIEKMRALLEAAAGAPLVLSEMGETLESAIGDVKRAETDAVSEGGWESQLAFLDDRLTDDDAEDLLEQLQEIVDMTVLDRVIDRFDGCLQSGNLDGFDRSNPTEGFLLIQQNRRSAAYYVSREPSREAAATAIESDEYAEDWDDGVLVDLSTGQSYDIRVELKAVIATEPNDSLPSP